MDKTTFDKLIDKINNGTATEEELAAYNAYMNQATNAGEDWDEHKFGKEARFEAQLLAEINKNIGYRTVKVRRLWPRIAAAASVLIVIGAGALFLLRKQPQPLVAKHDVAPYTAMAILKSGGKTIMLDKMGNGHIAQTHVIKSAGEKLAYAAGQESPVAIYDTLQIPAGGRPYSLQLSDGSKITLNAATTLIYPEAFTPARKEKIELVSGEIYAEVVHHPDAPLTIQAPGQLITDIGTEFNVNAYPDEPDRRTTLVSGSVSVSAAGHEKTLKPGQQTILADNELTVAKADLKKTLAWVKGDFVFNGENIHTVMRELARWYNIEVSYQGKVTETGFYIRIARSKNISQVLKMLERTNKVHFKIEGRRVTVYGKA